MLLKNEIKKIVLKQREELKKNRGIGRDCRIKLIPGFASIITGVRRCGKSTLVRQFLYNKKPVYYMNFEDISLADFTLKDFISLEEVFFENIGKKGIYYFDEIQNINGWERYIRQLVDKREKVIITGSNASMLSRELGTRLTGRHITTKLFPFSYHEFLKLKRKSHNIKLFEEYLYIGGFPEYIKSKDKDVLRNLYHDIFYRDIVVRNDIRDEVSLKSMLLYLLSNIGKEISFNKLKDIIGVASGNTVREFMNSFEDAYLLFPIRKFDYSLRKQMVNPKKVYCVDTALIDANAFSFSENKGRMIENVVFIELKRRGKEIYYHKGKNECDFVIKEGMKIKNAIQVSYSLDIHNKEREINGLLDAMRTYHLNKGLILTYNQEDKLKVDNYKIEIKPVWKWLLTT